MNNYSITTRRIRTTMCKNKTGTESSMTQMLMTTESTMPQRTSPLALHCTTERAHVVLFLAHFITLTLAQVRALSVLHSWSSSWPSMWLLSLRLDFLLLPLHLPPVCLPSPSSTSATSTSRSSTRRSWKTCATPPTTA